MEIGEGVPNLEAKKDGMPHELITQHLGLEFKSSPKGIPMHFVNRLRYWKAGKALTASNATGQYDHSKNEYYFRPNKDSKSELRVTLHESTHALYNQTNPEIGRLCNTAQALAGEVSTSMLLSMFANNLIDDKVFRFGADLKSIVQDMNKTYGFVSEGIAEWGAFEVLGLMKGLEGDDLMVEHLGIASSMEPLRAQNPAIGKYIDGHRFVSNAMFALQTLGVPRGEALLRLMLNPPKYSLDLEKGGVEYAAQELMVYS